MPAERCFVWVVSSLLFICEISGGALLVLYLIKPESPTTSWYPVTGIVLVCLPWFFWFITFAYRFLSRKLGFRMVCWGGADYPVDGQAGGRGGSFASRNGSMTRQVPGEAPSSNQAQRGEAGLPCHGGATTSSRDSHESETPLKLSMAS